jgi:hypothetical protein
MRHAARFGTLAAFLAVLCAGPGLAAATPISVGAGWSPTGVVPPAFFWTGTGPVFSSSGPFTFTSAFATVVSVTDDFCKGDRFRIFDGETSLGETPAVATGTCEGPGEVEGIGPDAAFADPTYSSGMFFLPPGSHSIAILVTANPFSGGRGYIRVDVLATAANDSYPPINEDNPLSVGAPGVLANDTGAGLTAELVAPPQHGAVVLSPDGSFTYTPDPDFNGVDRFLYLAKMMVGATAIESNVATVTITVRAVNDPPFFDVIADDFLDVPLNGIRTVDITGVAPGPVDEAGQTVQLEAVSSNPALVSNITISETGPTTRTLSYQRVSAGGGTATITVTATDNGGTADGGADTFVRTFDVTMDGAAAIQGTVTELIPNPDPAKPPKVAVVITADPIDFNGNGVIDCPGDAYFVFAPRPAPGQPFNVIPSDADTVPEAPPWRIGLFPDGDLVEVCATPLSFPAVIDLSEWKTSATGTTFLDYVSIVRDPELLDDGSCPPGSTCLSRIWTGVKPLGGITFNAGDTVAVKDTVTLKTLDTATKKKTSAPLANVQIRTFDIRSRDFQAVARDAVRSAPHGDPLLFFPLLSKVLGAIFEADRGRLGTCVTDASGRCLATQPAPAHELVVAKFVDPDTGKTVYTAVITRPRDFVDGLAEANHVIQKLFKKGVFQGYSPALLLHVR